MASPAPNNTRHKKQWCEIMISMYPDALSKTYRVPPMHFFRVPLRRGFVPGTGQPAFLLPSRTSATLPPPAKKRKKKKKKGSRTGTESHDSATNESHGSTTVQGACPFPEANEQAGPLSSDQISDQVHLSLGDTSPEKTAPGTKSSSSETGMWNYEPENPDRKDVNVLQTDLKDDFAQNHILINLQKLGEADQEIMFIVSQLNFKSYLNQLPSYAAAAQNSSTWIELEEKDQRGEFDILLFHRHRGILIGELKSIGLTDGEEQNLEERPDDKVKERMKTAMSQLDKSERVLKHLLRDVFLEAKIRKTIFLPYIKTSQLERILDNDPSFKQELTMCLGGPSDRGVSELCCCYEQLSRPKSYEDVTGSLDRLRSWWRRVLPQVKDSFFSDDDTYLDVVGSFVGPASTVDIHCNVPPHVEVRTEGNVVQEHGRRLARLVLTPQQLDIMQTAPPQVCLTGPPGTGKTVMLVLMALRWLQAGNDVYVVSTYPGSLAATYLIEEQLNMTLEELATATSSSSPPLPPPPFSSSSSSSSPTPPSRDAATISTTTSAGVALSLPPTPSSSSLSSSASGSSISSEYSGSPLCAAAHSSSSSPDRSDSSSSISVASISVSSSSSLTSSSSTSFSTSSSSAPSSTLSSLSSSTSPKPGRVFFKFYDMIYEKDNGSVDDAVRELTQAAQGKESFHVLMDEAKFTTCDLSEPQSKLLTELNTNVKNLHFWTVCLGNEDIPQPLIPVTLTVPLRCSPRVQRLMRPAMGSFKINGYSRDGVDYYLGDGQEVKEIVHGGEDHDLSSPWPLDCPQCGRQMAAELVKLGVGTQGPVLENSPPPLKYKDVFVLTRGYQLQDDEYDDEGNLKSPANGAIRGLREANIPVMVLRGRPPPKHEQDQWLSEVKDTAVAGTDHVVAAHNVIVSGLERKVLVFLPGTTRDYEQGDEAEKIDAVDKLYAISRCTTQLLTAKPNFSQTTS